MGLVCLCLCDGPGDDHLPVSLSIAILLCSADTFSIWVICDWASMHRLGCTQPIVPVGHSKRVFIYCSGVMITVSRRSYEPLGANDSSTTQLTLTRSASRCRAVNVAPRCGDVLIVSRLVGFRSIVIALAPFGWITLTLLVDSSWPCRSLCSLVCLEFPKATYCSQAVVHPPCA